MLLTRLDDIRERLAAAETIAVLGAHHETQRPAFYVPAYLYRMYYRVLPVNPRLAGTTLFGETVTASLAELPAPCDLVDIFRTPSALPGHFEEILALGPEARGRARVIWLQLGIVHRVFRDALVHAGFDVVEDRCTLADHRLFELPKKSPPATPPGPA